MKPQELVLNQIFSSTSTIQLLRSQVDDVYLLRLSGNNVKIASCAEIPQVFPVSQYDEMLRRAAAIGHGLEVVL